MTIVSLFRNTNMAALTSCENALKGKFGHVVQIDVCRKPVNGLKMDWLNLSNDKKKSWKRKRSWSTCKRLLEKMEISLSYLVWFALLTVLRAMLVSGYLDLARSSDLSIYSLYIASLCSGHFQSHLQTTSFIKPEQVMNFFNPRTA